jgi:hypothetical protein
LKYIILKVGIFDCPILLPNVLDHKTVANSLKEGLYPKYGKVEIVSAGFAKVQVEAALGQSFTLGIKSRPEDLALIQMVARM